MKWLKEKIKALLKETGAHKVKLRAEEGTT
jgi:hypothetical protein